MPQINQLPPVITPASSDQLVVQQTDGITRAATPSDLAKAQGLGGAAYLNAGGPNGAAVLDPSGNASALSVLATGATTVRTLAARAGDFLNLLDFLPSPYQQTDISAGLIAAANQALALSLVRGNVAPGIFVPGGNYVLLSNAVLPNTAIYLFGNGDCNINTAGFSIIQNNLKYIQIEGVNFATFSDEPSLILNFPAQASSAYPLFKLINCTFQIVGSAPAIVITNSFNGFIDGLFVAGLNTTATDAVQFIGTTVNTVIQNSTLNCNCTRSGWYFKSTAANSVQGVRFTNVTGTGTGGGTYFDCSQYGGALIQYANCMFDSISNTAMYFDSVTVILISGTWVAAGTSGKSSIVFGPTGGDNVISMSDCNITAYTGAPYTFEAKGTGGVTINIFGGNLNAPPSGSLFSSDIAYNRVGVYDSGLLAIDGFTSSGPCTFSDPLINNGLFDNTLFTQIISGTASVTIPANCQSADFYGSASSLAITLTTPTSLPNQSVTLDILFEQAIPVLTWSASALFQSVLPSSVAANQCVSLKYFGGKWRHQVFV